MKKIVAVITAVGISFGAFGQGFISLNDSVSVKVSFNGTGSAVAMGTTALQYYFTALAWSGVGTPTVTSLNDLKNANWFDTGVIGNNGTTGPKAGTVAAPTASTQLTGPWSQPGNAANYVIVGWTATEGTTWAGVLSQINSGTWQDSTATGGLGWSTIGNITAGGGPLGVSLWGTSGSTVNTGFVIDHANVAPVPEPATIALAGLGGLALLALRRKK
ncbi:MAG: PEP-CTERM sorting domain-containing protein [Verrucomicrobiota bacterium]